MYKIIFIIITTLTLAPIPASSATNNVFPVLDKYEDDNNWATANIIQLNNQTSGDFAAGYEPIQLHNFHDTNDEDWFVFTCIPDKTYKLEAFEAQSECDAQIEIYEEDGITLAYDVFDSYFEGEAEIAEFICGAVGLYYAKVTNVFDAPVNQTAYKISLSEPVASFPGFIYGTLSPVIPLALLSTGYGSALVLPNGYFFMPHSSGSFFLKVNQAGYKPFSQHIVVNELSTTTVNIVLEPIQTCTKKTWYRDSDSDGFGEINQSKLDCNQPAGYVLDNTDCNDNEAAVHLGAVELCDMLDNNCNQQIDEMCPQYDLNGDGNVSLVDLDIVLKVLTMNPLDGMDRKIRGDFIGSDADMDNDGKIGIQELIQVIRQLQHP